MEIVGRVGETWTQNRITGYFLRLDERGHWALRVVYDYKRNETSPKEKELAAGELPSAAGTGKWHKVSLSFPGAQIKVAIDDQVVGQTVEDTSH